MDSPYYSKLELCGGSVMVSFLKYLPWQAMHFLQCSTHFLKMCCRLSITLKFIALEILPHAIFGLFQPWKGSFEARNFKVINSLQHILRSGWSIVRSASLAKGGTSKKETVTVPPQSSDSE
jgi:hypothetical protein